MHIALRAAAFSLMTLFASCGVGAQDLDARIGTIAMQGEPPAQTSLTRLGGRSGEWKMPLLNPVNTQQ
ncbi:MULTISPECIES: hypothetical protein [unclassified Pseudomonas]|uniref:hypothetical protein n=1 Tax=unclassified Pseudomonas TaxID=196821 RepID=UPI00191411BF|nr:MULTISPECIES: hypothetical protein [unclassified Pseudomonas]MBK5373631.1 hypothetical protein [Pseudomonas sp. TH43]MBK5512417.1 hypothetical protein [Pseudomonas sp. TH15]